MSFFKCGEDIMNPEKELTGSTLRLLEWAKDYEASGFINQDAKLLYDVYGADAIRFNKPAGVSSVDSNVPNLED
jgi:hypothetical protein